LFDPTPESSQLLRNKKKHSRKNKIAKSKVQKDKDKAKDVGSEKLTDFIIPEIELHGNPSSFAVYSNIRRVVLEDQIKKISQIYLQSSQPRGALSDSEDESSPERIADSIIKLPKVVGLGLCGVFELIRETHTSHPALCTRALHALLDMLQGQQPESLRNEPKEAIDSLYHLLMELSQSRSGLSSTTTPQSVVDSTSESESLSALACSCMLSLVIARGDTGKLLTAIATMLIYSSKLASQLIKIPRVLVSLQKSVQAVLTGKVTLPDWLNYGIRCEARVSSTVLSSLAPFSHCEAAASLPVTPVLASDGRYVYVHSRHGLCKIGTGYLNTIMGYVYACNASFHCKDQGWLAVIKGQLVFKCLSDMQGILTVINTTTLQPANDIQLDGKSYGPSVMFSDGDYIGHLAASKDDSFVFRTFEVLRSPVTLINELPLKLTRKCLDVFGAAMFGSQEDLHSTDTSLEDAVNILSGKEFALMRTTSGKIMFTGKSQALGIKPTAAVSSSNNTGGGASNWTELPIMKSPKIVQYSVGHEGSHGLLVTDDGAVFFVGLAKRGEDGDPGNHAKARRQVKPVKPKKMIRMEGKNVVSSACNSGTSALVTSDGEVYMFGKDTQHCDRTTGLLSDLRGIVVTSVSLGKAHTALLTNTGQVYTFGLNNKGQCGRDYVPTAPKEVSVTMKMADDGEEDTEEDTNRCPASKHRWEHQQCMVCTVCSECTGYGNSCISSARPDRLPGQPCGCGSGDSGCAECGSCRACAGEKNPEMEHNMVLSNGIMMDVVAFARDPIPFELLLDRPKARQMVEDLMRDQGEVLSGWLGLHLSINKEQLL